MRAIFTESLRDLSEAATHQDLGDDRRYSAEARSSLRAGTAAAAMWAAEATASDDSGWPVRCTSTSWSEAPSAGVSPTTTRVAAILAPSVRSIRQAQLRMARSNTVRENLRNTVADGVVAGDGHCGDDDRLLVPALPVEGGQGSGVVDPVVPGDRGVERQQHGITSESRPRARCPPIVARLRSSGDPTSVSIPVTTPSPMAATRGSSSIAVRVVVAPIRKPPSSDSIPCRGVR